VNDWCQQITCTNIEKEDMDSTVRIRIRLLWALDHRRKHDVNACERQSRKSETSGIETAESYSNTTFCHVRSAGIQTWGFAVAVGNMYWNRVHERSNAKMSLALCFNFRGSEQEIERCASMDICEAVWNRKKNMFFFSMLTCMEVSTWISLNSSQSLQYALTNFRAFASVLTSFDNHIPKIAWSTIEIQKRISTQ
jgi:hypothetical protein